MFEDVDLSYAFRPGIVESMIRHDKYDFKTGQLESLSGSTEVGKVAKSLVEAGYMEVNNVSQDKRYSLDEEIKNELETRQHDEVGKIMKYAKDKWSDVLEDKAEGYDMQVLEEDIPEGLHISESNKGTKKLLELKNHTLSDETKNYLSNIGVITDPESMEIKADYIDIIMLENYFQEH